ncbi:MAG: hypothetical protein ACTHJG_05755 [Rhodanobacteraceae bacterium]
MPWKPKNGSINLSGIPAHWPYPCAFPDGNHTGGSASKKIARNAKHRARSEQRVKLDQPPLEDDVGFVAVEAAGGVIAVEAAGGVIAVEAAGGVIAGAVAAGAAIVEDAAAPLF